MRIISKCIQMINIISKLSKLCVDRFRGMHDCLVPIRAWSENVFESIRKTKRIPCRVRAVNMRSLLLLLPFLLHILFEAYATFWTNNTHITLAESYASHGLPPRPVDRCKTDVHNPQAMLILLVHMLLSWLIILTESRSSGHPSKITLNRRLRAYCYP